MATKTGPEALLEFWKQQFEEGTKAADPSKVWRPFMDQGIAAWAAIMARGPVSPDLMAQWKQFLDEWITAWGKALEQAMGTEAFAQALGRYLEQWTAVQAPVQKAAADMAQALGMASRVQLSDVARHVADVEERIETISDQVGALTSRIDSLIGGGSLTQSRAKPRSAPATRRSRGKNRR